MFGRKRYFLRCEGAFFIAVLALVMAAIIFFLLLPHIIAISMVFIFLALIFILIWVIIYVAMILGAAAYHFMMPFHMKENEETE